MGSGNVDCQRYVKELNKKDKEKENENEMKKKDNYHPLITKLTCYYSY